MDRSNFNNEIQFKVRLMPYDSLDKVRTQLIKNGGFGYETNGSFVMEGNAVQLLNAIEHMKTFNRSYEIIGMKEQWIGTPIEVEEILTKMMREEKLNDLDI